jgi:hypothetical protein
MQGHPPPVRTCHALAGRRSGAALPRRAASFWQSRSLRSEKPRCTSAEREHFAVHQQGEVERVWIGIEDRDVIDVLLGAGLTASPGAV